jgi:N,N-dimethylformamidase beta subunit-like, C-terminal
LTEMKEIVLIVTVIVLVALLMNPTMTKISFGQQNDTIRPSVHITNPPYPPTVTTSKIIIQGTANDSESGIKAVSIDAHAFPFTGKFSVPFPSAPIPITPNNWSHWSVPLTINTTGTYRILVSASDGAGNIGYAETAINAQLSPGPKVAFVRPTFTEAAYQPHGFYTFYFKYKFPPFGTKITTDTDMFTVKIPTSVPSVVNEPRLRNMSNLTAVIPLTGTGVGDVSFHGGPAPQAFWMPFVEHVQKDVPNASVTVIRDEDINDGHIFTGKDNKTNVYNALFLFHDEYVTQDEYNNLRQFVSNGGTIVFIDANVFYAQVHYDRENRTATLVKGHDWQFDGKVITRGPPERWFNETREWVGANWLVSDISTKITFTNNPFNYTHFEEQFVNNPNDKIIMDYGIKFPKNDSASTPGHENGKTKVSTYSLQYGKGKVIMIGLSARLLADNDAFLNFFDGLVKSALPTTATSATAPQQQQQQPNLQKPEQGSPPLFPSLS